jgi:glutaredoxin
MAAKRKVEVFTAGCAACDEAVALVKAIACSSCDIAILDMHDTKIAAKAKRYGIRSVPAVVIDGKLADCCRGGGVEEASLRAAGIGVPLP